MAFISSFSSTGSSVTMASQGRSRKSTQQPFRPPKPRTALSKASPSMRLNDNPPSGSTDPLNSTKAKKRQYVEAQLDEDDDESQETSSPLHDTPPRSKAVQSKTTISQPPKKQRKTKDTSIQDVIAMKTSKNMSIKSKASAVVTGTSQIHRPSLVKPPTTSLEASAAKPGPLVPVHITQDAPRPTLEDGQVGFIQYTKSENDALKELEIANRQHFAAGLTKTKVDLPVQQVFPGVAATNIIYRTSLAKTKRDYKNWRSTIVKKTISFMKQWIENHDEEDTVKNSTKFSELQELILDDYEAHWLPVVFTPLVCAIDFQKITALGNDFLKYALVKLMVNARLVHIFETTRLPSLIKYDEDRMYSVFDSMYRLRNFENLAAADFPLLSVQKSSRSVIRPLLDPNEDSDGVADDEFFKSRSESRESREESRESEGEGEEDEDDG